MTGWRAVRVAVVGWLVPPRDRLTTGLDSLVALVDRAPVAPSPGPGCMSSMSFSTYVVVLRYPTGVRTVGGDTERCDSLVAVTPLRP